jgi:hypothetical protein
MMEDVTLTQLFEKMDAHLERQDVHLPAITATLREQNAVLAQMAQMLATTARELDARRVEASQRFNARDRHPHALTRTRLHGHDGR